MIARAFIFGHIKQEALACFTKRTKAGYLKGYQKQFLYLPSSVFQRTCLLRTLNVPIRGRTNIFLRDLKCRKYSSTPDGKIVESGKKSLMPKSSEVKRLLSLAKPERFRLLGAIGLLIISSAVTISVPFAMGKVIDTIYKSSQDTSKMMEDLSLLCKVLVVIFVCGAAANFGRIFLMETSGQRIIKRLREKLYQSIVRQEIAFFDKTRTGELINRLSADASKVGNSVTRNVSDGLRSAVQVIGGVSMMVFTSPKLASIVLAIVPPMSIIAVLYGRFVRSISKKVQDSLAKSTELAEERISSIRTVRAFAQEAREIESYASRIQEVFQLTKKEAWMWGLFFSAVNVWTSLFRRALFFSSDSCLIYCKRQIFFVQYMNFLKSKNLSLFINPCTREDLHLNEQGRSSFDKEKSLFMEWSKNSKNQ